MPSLKRLTVFRLGQLFEQPAMLACAEQLGFIATVLAERPLEWACRSFSIVVIGAQQGSHSNVWFLLSATGAR